MNESIFLLSKADAEYFSKVTAALEVVLADESTEQKNETTSISREQARRITKRLPDSPAAVIEKWEDLTQTPVFMLMEALERDANGEAVTDWYYLKGEQDSTVLGMPILFPIDRASRASKMLEASGGNLDEHTLCEVADALCLTGYRYIPLKTYSDIEFAVNVCKKIESLPPSFSSKIPEKTVIPNNKLVNVLAEIAEGEENAFTVSQRNKRQILSSCLLTYQGDKVTLSGRHPFTEYDRNVYNAVCSLYKYGGHAKCFSPQMVFRAMTGQTDTSDPSKCQIAAVTRSLDKMRFIRAKVDCTEELQARNIQLDGEHIKDGVFDAYLLAAEALTMTAGGQKETVYHVMSTPVLLAYAEAVKQVLTLPASLLDVREVKKEKVQEETAEGEKKETVKYTITKDRLADTEQRILIKGYLLRRIEGMKGKNRLASNVIKLYDYEEDNKTRKGLYSIIGNPDPTRTEASRIRADVEAMFEYWAAMGYIEGFEAQIEKKKITGYEIKGAKKKTRKT